MDERALAIVLVLVVLAGSQPALIMHRVMQALLTYTR